MTQLRLFFIILILNALVVLLYILLNILLFKRKNRSFVLCSIVMLLCPVVGPCFFVLALILFRLFYYDPVDLEDVVFSKARARTFIHAEEERESNLAPLEEAIEITEASELRTLMMSVVRGDIQNSLATIALAMNSEDTETAHYAASVLQSTLNVFQENVEKQYALIRQEDENRLQYADALVDYMNQLRMDGMEKREAIIQAGKSRLRPVIMTALTTILGLSTMALGMGMGADMVQPMAIVTIGGLLYGTLLTLYVVPCIYDILNRKEYKRDEERLDDGDGKAGDDDALPQPVKEDPDDGDL